jgi:hypothetical protein
LAGIKANLPEVTVVVVDDGGATGDGIISLPFDSGLSAKRNTGVAATKTKYILMGSDDFDFSTEEARRGIMRLLSVLEANFRIDVAGGHVNGDIYEGDLIVAPGQYIAQTKLVPSETGITPCDLVVNYFLARTESIRPYPWDARMKIGGEHGDWFLTLKENGLRVVAVSGVNITTLPYDRSKEDPRYGDFRGRASTLGHVIFLRKRGVVQFYGAGETIPDKARLPFFKKVLIALYTCDNPKYKQRVEKIENTWVADLRAVGYDVQIFTGAVLGVPDDYGSLTLKTKALCRWAVERGYDHILKIDDDSYVNASQFHVVTEDYAGIRMAANDFGSPLLNIPHFITGTFPHGYASGGAYWLSRRSMELVATAELTGDWAEDRWVGHVLTNSGIPITPLVDYGIAQRGVPVSHYFNHKVVVLTQVDLSVPINAHYQPPIIPQPSTEWKTTFLEHKVRSLFKRFRYVVATAPGSSHYKALCKIYPQHLEEQVETPEGVRVVFIVEK